MSAWPTGASTTPRPTPVPLTISGTASVDVVGEQPVRRLAVVAERLAVIGGDDDQRAIERAAPRSRSSSRPSIASVYATSAS